MFKRFILTAVLAGLISTPLLGASLGFSTGGANTFSWTLSVLGGPVIRMTFENNEVDTCSVLGDAVLNDAIELPEMNLIDKNKINIAPDNDIITAKLVPLAGGKLKIKADVDSGAVLAGDTVMSATLVTGGIVTVGTNYIAYSLDQDDMDIDFYVPGYSSVIDSFATFDGQGFDVDLSFGGDSSESLFDLLDAMDVDSVSGTLSGQIDSVPEPTTLVLLGLGGLALRRRR